MSATDVSAIGGRRRHDFEMGHEKEEEIDEEIAALRSYKRVRKVD